MTDRNSTFNKPVYSISAIIAVILLVYLNTLSHGLVWDDNVVFLKNSLMYKSPIDFLSSIDNGRVTDVTPYYRPLTLLSFWLEKRIHGFDPFYIRVTNVSLHIVNVSLIFYLLRILSVSSVAALIATLLFAIHPINSEVVNFNAGGRNTMLAAAFLLLALILYLRSNKSRSLMFSLLSAVSLFAGMLSKETAVMLIPLMFYLEKSSFFDSSLAERKSAFLRLTPSVIAAAIYFFMRHNALKAAGVSMDIGDGLMGRLLNNIFIIPRYMINMFRLDLLSPVYYLPDDLNLYLLQLLAGWGLIIFVAFWIMKYNWSKKMELGVIAAFLFWIPVSGIFPIPSAVMADRYVYIPFIGVLILIGSLVEKYIVGVKKFKKTKIAAFLLSLTLMSGYTIYHNHIWKDEVTLFSWLVKMYPDQAMPYHNLACAYLDEKKDAHNASMFFEKAYSINPVFPKLRTQMGYVAFMRGDLKRAEDHYLAALSQDQLDSEALFKYAELLELTGKPFESIAYYKRFVSLKYNELPFAIDEAINRVKRLEDIMYTQ